MCNLGHEGNILKTFLRLIKDDGSRNQNAESLPLVSILVA